MIGVLQGVGFLVRCSGSQWLELQHTHMESIIGLSELKEQRKKKEEDKGEGRREVGLGGDLKNGEAPERAGDRDQGIDVTFYRCMKFSMTKLRKTLEALF